mmetsp:Transcript_70337/g.205707  ORF Transcript_70337/g.205707 Transcript_70337/m.205707 type:complete len:223 (-) Transcript_70337:402-1070(-)
MVKGRVVLQLHGGRPVLHPHGEALQDQALGLAGHAPPAYRRKLPRLQAARCLAAHGVEGKGRLRQKEHRQPHGPNVRPLVRFVSKPHLGRQKVWCAALAEHPDGLLLPPNPHGTVEIADLQSGRGIQQEQVRWLDVSVQNTLSMKVFYTFDQLERQCHASVVLEGTVFLHVLCHISVATQLLKYPELVGQLHQLRGPDDARVVQVPHDLELHARKGVVLLVQ